MLHASLRVNWPMEQTFASTVLLPKSIVTTHKLTFEKSQMGVFWLLLAFRLRIAFMFYFSCVCVCMRMFLCMRMDAIFFCHSLYLCIITKRPKYQIYGYETSAHLCIVIVLFRMVMTRCFPIWTFWSLLWGHTHFQHWFFILGHFDILAYKIIISEQWHNFVATLLIRAVSCLIYIVIWMYSRVLKLCNT